MAKIKTVYDNLLPDVKSALQASARQYSAAKRLKYTLMSKTMWSVSYTHLTLPTKA